MQFELDIQKTLYSHKYTFQLDVAMRSSSKRMVILGPSGAGKSVLLRSIAGLLTPDSGIIKIDEKVLFDSVKKINIKPQQRHLAYLFQSYVLFPHLTVLQNISFALKGGILNPSRNRGSAEVGKWLDAFELRSLVNHYPHEISGGQQQRTALARALVSNPKLLLLDEPFSALDVALRQKMRHEISTLQQLLDIPIILITHDVEDANFFGDFVLELENGKSIN